MSEFIVAPGSSSGTSGQNRKNTIKMSKEETIGVEDIKIPADLQTISRKPNIHADFRKCIDALSCEYIADQGILRITTNKLDATKKRIKMLKDVHFRALRLAMEKDEIKRNKYLIIEEFDVAKDLIGLSLGSKGRNIKDVNNIEGVTADLIKGTCTFLVKAKSKKLAEKARDRLEYVRHCVKVPRALGEAILSNDGAVITDVIKKSGITKIEVGDDNLTEDDEEIPFSLVGPAKKVADAVALFEYHLTIVKTDVQLGSTINTSSEESDEESTSNSNHTESSSVKKSRRKAKFQETLVIPKKLMGLAVGKNGSNINKAAKLAGIVDIKAKDSSFEIFGNDKETMAEARKILDFTEELVEFDYYQAQRIRAIFKEIQTQSGAFRIEVKEEKVDKYVFNIIGQAHTIPIAKAFMSMA